MLFYSFFDRLHSWFRPTLVALFYPNIPWNLRWRLFVFFQPTVFLSHSIAAFPYIFSRPFTVEYLQISPTQIVRSLVYKKPGVGRGRKLRPLHIDIHSGGFVGGIPETLGKYDDRVARETGAVVICITYRLAPEHPFPAAIDDVDATIKWIQEHAEERWGADPTLMTVGGISAGGNLAMAATQQKNCQAPSPTAIKAIVTFYAPLDLRSEPGKKPRPTALPKNDPAAPMFPLFDSYATEARKQHFHDPRLSPMIAERYTLPEKILLVVPGLDILVHEQMEFADWKNTEDMQEGRITPRIEVLYDAKAFHGYLERMF